MKQTVCRSAILGPKDRTVFSISFLSPIGVFLTIFLFSPVPAFAEEQKSAANGHQGDYSSTAKAIGRYQFAGIGEGISAALYEWKITMTNDSGEGFLHNVPGECVGLGLYEEGMDHQSGYCTYTDSDGDKFYERYEHFGIVGEGKGWSLGGTGKYDGIETTHDYKFDAFSAEEGSHFESVSKRTGTYKFRAPVAASSE